jgi:hypothetical protein
VLQGFKEDLVAAENEMAEAKRALGKQKPLSCAEASKERDRLFAAEPNGDELARRHGSGDF